MWYNEKIGGINKGKKEDTALELEFWRICQGENHWNKNLPFAIRLIDKKANSAGLQLADMVARPIGVHYLNPNQPNRAFEILKQKFYCKNKSVLGKDFENFGLTIFPQG